MSVAVLIESDFMKNKKREAGFSLVEIVVASVLLAIIAAGIFSVTISAKKIISSSSQRKMAMEVAATILENMRVYLGDNNWTSNSCPPTPPGPCTTGSPFSYKDKGWMPKLWWLGRGSDTYDLHSNDYFEYQGLANKVADTFRGSEFDTRYNGRWRLKIASDATYDYLKVEVEVLWDEPEF